MAGSTAREAARNRAQSHFTASEQRDEAVKQIIAGENAAREAKTAKLRALRLAKEAADAALAVKLAADAPAKKPAAAKKKSARTP